MITVLAEKPSVAKDIAKYLGATNKKDGYLEGNNYAVTWAFGHLVEIKSLKELGYDSEWSLNTLPFIPNDFELKVSKDANKQFQVIKNLFDKSSKIICATDAGREGELIFRYIYNLSKSKTKFERLWISSLTDQAIKDGFSKLKKGSDFDNLYYSAKARNEADYIVGINATIGMTAKAGSGLLSLGRVQTPTLALICERYLQNINFKPVPYYTPEILLFPLNKLEFKARFENNFPNEDEAKLVNDAIGAILFVTDVSKKEVKENPPQLFDLTSLQMEANKRYGFSAQKTLSTAQKLYEEHKILSYPRTASKYLSDDMISIIPGLLNDILKFHDKKDSINFLLQNKISSRPIDNSKVTDHHAIIPTEKNVNFSNLNDDEKSIYMLVVNRFLEAFMPVCIKENSTVIIDSEKGKFSASGSIIIESGWRSISEKISDDELENEEKLPTLKIGEKLSVIKKEIKKSFTKPLPLFNESSLLHIMETAGKLVEDSELSQAMKDGGLGTPATRASIIELLLRRNFIAREKKNIIPTDLGLNLYIQVKDLKISKAELTGEWESKLMQIEKGNYSFDLFNSEIKCYIGDLIDSIKSLKIESFDKTIIACPFCSNGQIVEKGNQFSCNNIHAECNFPIIWKKISNQTISTSHVIELVKNNKSSLIKGFINKENKQFDASLTIDKDSKKLIFDFSKSIIGDCPKCKTGKVEDYSKTLKCNNIVNCDFIIFKEIAQKKISIIDLTKLIKEGKTNLIKGFTSRTGSHFDAKLTLDSMFKVSFEFLKK
ncbi:DNA topoisomerase 3 [Flavobacterium sp. 17A]|uniref:DNA topoisomerase n=1 Tax=Flavobacterium potami TaxID=2872310 RepID=A0A9X1KSV0_9FLAO|nr:type IA DNA topoisomerase [Flavobacterium potami]MBZ4037794.1 DNA topoisomerase 3 [Flavobacterium potami]